METAPVAENAVGHIAHGNGGLRCVFCTISTMEMVVFFGGGGLVDKKKQQICLLGIGLRATQTQVPAVADGNIYIYSPHSAFQTSWWAQSTNCQKVI